MTQEYKELLLKDLSARLLDGVKVLNIVEGVYEVCELDSIMTSRKHKDKIFVSLTLADDSVMTGIEMIKPYLRLMSSMTDEERVEYFVLSHRDNDRDDNEIMLDEAKNLIDWLNANHLDYRGLIEKGLAIEALEGMYEI